jgi:hypothetical protein
MSKILISSYINTKGGTKMPIIVKGKEFELCPAGLHHAKVREISQFRHKEWGERVKFTFETDKIGKEGQNLSVFHEASLSLSPKAKLTSIVEGVIGRPITPEERKQGFDLEKLVGMNCFVNVKHKFSQAGNQFAFVDAVIANGNRQQQSSPTIVEKEKEADKEATEDNIPF